MKNLSERQAEVLRLLNAGFKKKDIAARLKISKPAVSKLVKKIKEKTAEVNRLTPPSEKGDAYKHAYQFVTKQGQTKYYRLHNLHLVIEPYYFFARYSDSVGEPAIRLGKWTVAVNRTNIEVQLRRKESFDSESLDDCYYNFREELEALIPKLENRIGCGIWKEQKLNIWLVNQHVAEVNNGIARKVEGQRLTVTGEDGKVRVIVDISTGKPELETVHAKLAREDMKELERHIHAMLKPDTPTVAELSGFVAKSFELSERQASSMLRLTEEVAELKRRFHEK